ncbi:MAG: hypothetical protein GXP55_11390 [Deltaproteobacteria bacterium]|nr:hypothetical protein [Deltaproteobacteria bacterium]
MGSTLWNWSWCCAALLMLSEGCYLSHTLEDGAVVVRDARRGDASADAHFDGSEHGDAGLDAHIEAGDATLGRDAAADADRIDSGVGVIPVGEVARRLALAECEGILACGPVFGSWTSEAGCVAARAHFYQTVELPLWVAASEASELTYDAAAFGRCLDRIRGTGCSKRGSMQYRACEEAFRGLIPDGEPCRFEFHCQPGSTCSRGGRGICPGVCVPNKALGEPCTGMAFECGEGARCNGVCEPGLSAGDTCGGREYGDLECAEGLVCDLLPLSRPDPRTGTCRVFDTSLAGLGQPCDPKLGPHCSGDLACALVMTSGLPGTDHQVCARRSASGAACTPSSPPECPANETCHGPSSVSLIGTCLPFPQFGEECRDVGCQNTQICRGPGTPTCQYWPGPGEPCDGTSHCQVSSSCDMGVCPELPCEPRVAYWWY